MQALESDDTKNNMKHTSDTGIWFMGAFVGAALIILVSSLCKESVRPARQALGGKAVRKGPFAVPMTIARALFSFDGRLSRSDYWCKGILPLLPLNLLNFVLGTRVHEDWAFNLAVFISIVALWPGMALIAKRLHDRDQPAWHMLVLLIPIVGPVLLIVGVWFMKGTEGPNRFGPDPLNLRKHPGNESVMAVNLPPPSR
jgi:uncharacterized membrane protein YhaH (DUF805 family)